MAEVSSIASADRAHSGAQARTIDPAAHALLLALQAAVFMVAAEARVIAPLLPAIAADFHTSIATTGLLITAYSVPYGLFQLVYGPLADRFSRQRVMGVALSLFAIGTMVSGLAPDMRVLTVLRVCTGAAAAGVIPVALAYISDAVPYARRQAVLGRIVSIAAFGGVISAALGGLIAALASWRALFFGYGLLALFVATLLLWLPVRRARVLDYRPSGVLDPYRVIFVQAGARAVALYGLVFFEGFAAMSTLGYLGALLFERDHLSYGVIGVLLTLNGIGTMGAAWAVGRLVARLGERGMLLAGGALMTVAYLLATLQPTFLYFPVAMLLSGAGFAIAHSTLQTRATELVPAMRGTAIAIFAFALLLGGGLGTYLAGQAIERVGFPLTLVGTAVALALFTVISVPLLRIGQAAGE